MSQLRTDPMFTSVLSGKQVFTGATEIIAVVCHSGAAAACSCQVYDGTSTSGKLMFAFELAAGQTAVFPLPAHSYARFETGVFVQMTGAGSRVFLYKNGEGHLAVTS